MKKKLFFYAEDAGSKVFMSYLYKSLQNLCDIKFFSKGFKNYNLDLASDIKYLSSEEILEAFDKSKIDIIFLGFSINLSMNRKISEIAWKKNILTIAVSDSVKNIDFIYWDKKKKLCPELIIVPDYHTKKYFLDCGYKNNIFISGHPHYEGLRKSNIPTKKSKLKLPFRVEKNTKIILFIDEPKIPNIDKKSFKISYSNSKRSTKIIPIIQKAINKINLDIKLLVLRHPADKNKKYIDEEVLINIYQNNSKYEIILISDLIIGISSSLLIEASLLEKQTISFTSKKEYKEEISSLAPTTILRLNSYVDMLDALKKVFFKGGIAKYKYKKKKPTYEKKIKNLFLKLDKHTTN